jgi:hypothetical protein
MTRLWFVPEGGCFSACSGRQLRCGGGPRQKDLDKIKALMDAVSICGIDKNPDNSF